MLDTRTIRGLWFFFFIFFSFVFTSFLSLLSLPRLLLSWDWGEMMGTCTTAVGEDGKQCVITIGMATLRARIFTRGGTGWSLYITRAVQGCDSDVSGKTDWR